MLGRRYVPFPVGEKQLHLCEELGTYAHLPGEGSPHRGLWNIAGMQGELTRRAMPAERRNLLIDGIDSLRTHDSFRVSVTQEHVFLQHPA